MEIKIIATVYPGGSDKFTVQEGTDLHTLVTHPKFQDALELKGQELKNLVVKVKSVDAASFRVVEGDLRAYNLKAGDKVHIDKKVKGNTPGAASEDAVKIFSSLVEKLVRPEDRSTEELLSSYDPDKEGIVRELQRRGQGNPFIVLQEDGKVDVAASKKILEAIRDGIAVANEMEVDGKMVAVFRPGERAVRYANVCPITGEFLVDEYCSKISRSWAEFDKKARELILVQIRYVDMKRPDKLTEEEIRQYVSEIFTAGPKTEGIQKLYPKAVMLLGEFKANSQPVNGLRKPLPGTRIAAHQLNMGGKAVTATPKKQSPVVLSRDEDDIYVDEDDDDDDDSIRL